MFNMMNDIQKIYEGKEITYAPKTGVYTCPVCKKSFKREANANTHLSKQECYDIKDIVRGTEREKDALTLFKSMMAVIAPRARTNIYSFRKNKLYKPVVRFSLTCSYYNIKNPELYYAWVRDVKDIALPNAILSRAATENSVTEFREWLMQNPDYIQSARFIARQPDDYMEDAHYLLRSFEKAHLSLKYFLQYYGISFDELYNAMSDYPEHQMRLSEVKSITYGEKNDHKSGS